MGVLHEFQLAGMGAAVRQSFKETEFYNKYRGADWSYQLSFDKKTSLEESINAGEKNVNHVVLMFDLASRHHSDTEFLLLVQKFIERALKCKEIRDASHFFEMGKGELRHIFLSALLGTMPNPVYKSGGPVLTPVRIFQEKGKHLTELLEDHSKVAKGKPLDVSRNLLSWLSSSMGREIKRQHDVAYGEVPL